MNFDFIFTLILGVTCSIILIILICSGGEDNE